MNLRHFSLLLTAIMVVAVFAACGGGQQGGSQGNGGSGGGGENTGKDRPETQNLEGRVARVDLENNRVVVRPQEGEPVSLLIRPEGDNQTEFTLDGNEASPEDIEQGQGAQVEYRVVTNEEKDRERNVALSMSLTPAQGGGTGAEETTGS